MQKPKSLEKPVARALRRVAVFIGLLACIAGIYVSIKIAEADRFYAYRRADKDHDTVADYHDDDLDGDTIPNAEDTDADGDSVENWTQAVDEALKLIGRPVDMLDGALHNLGVRMGRFRSADVVLVAYEKTGLYLAPEIEKDALVAPNDYADVMRGGNVDVHDARALGIFFNRQGWDLVTWRIAQKGDVMFFGHDVVGVVVDYEEPDGYTVVWANPDTRRVEKASTSRLEANGLTPSVAASIGQ